MLKSLVVFAVLAIYLAASLPLGLKDKTDQISGVHHRSKRASNGLIDIKRRWPNRTVPFRINTNDFSKENSENFDFIL
jgi:hypothetical protein